MIYYGTEVPLSQVANVNVEDSRTLTVTPWEKYGAAGGEAILKSDLGSIPTLPVPLFRVPAAALTEERRKRPDPLSVVRGGQNRPGWRCAMCGVMPTAA